MAPRARGRCLEIEPVYKGGSAYSCRDASRGERDKTLRTGRRRTFGPVRWARPIGERGFDLKLSYRAGADDELAQLESIVEALDEARKHAKKRLRDLQA